MTKSWLDLLTVLLTALVVGIACFDFLLGKAGRRKLQSSMENVWLKFSYIQWPHLGAAEALTFVGWMDRTFGARLVSWRRLTTTTLLVVVAICVGYVAYEAARAIEGKPLRWPFAPPHWETGFPEQVFPAMVSISITRLMVAGSIRLLSTVRGGSFLFILAIGIGGYLSAAAAFVAAFSFDVAVYALQMVAAAGYDHLVAAMGGTPVNIDHFRLFPLAWTRVMIGISLAKIAILSPTDAWWFFFHLAQHNDVGLVRAWYDFCISFSLGGIRLAFALAFIGAWLFLTPIRWITSVVLLRLAEAERGALTVLSAGFALLAKFLQEYLKV